jgi:CPA1 family monovalent cation:H+ antiporter
MRGLELVVVLGAVVLLGGLVARRYQIAPPVVLFSCGRSAGIHSRAAPGASATGGDAVPLSPALLYWESLTTSLREIRRNLRGIILASTVLVIATAAAVAAVGHALGLPWGPAWVLGAAVAPTDATAVTALARTLPRRELTVLRAESLINDGTALVIYGVAVGVTVGEEHLSGWYLAWLFLVAYAGGAAAGLAIGWLVVQVRHRLDDPLLGNVLTILTPFTAFLLAELIHASGVLAVVVCGFMLSQAVPRSSELTRGKSQSPSGHCRLFCSTQLSSCWLDWSCSLRARPQQCCPGPGDWLRSVP